MPLGYILRTRTKVLFYRLIPYFFDGSIFDKEKHFEDYMKKKIGIVLLVIIALIIFRWGSGKFGELMRTKMMGAMMTPKVKLSTVGEIEYKNEIEAPGRVVAKYSVDLVARVDGYLLEKKFNEGDYVKKGQLLFVIEPQQYLIALNKAQADLATARAQAIKASKDFARSKELVAKDYIAKSTYDETLAQRDVANASVKAAIAAVSDAKRNYNYTRITSPIDGRIGMLNVTQGNYVSTQSGSLARVVSTNPIYVTYNVDSKQFANLRDNEIIPKNKNEQPISVEVTLPDGTKYEHKGVEDFWDNQISQTTGTIALRATFQNPDNRLIPGDFVKVKVYSNKLLKKTVIPQDYVLQDSTGRYVYVVDKDSIARKKYIKISNEYQKFWIVTQGLKPGDEYIGEGLVKVLSDKPVVVLKDDELIKLKDKK